MQTLAAHRQEATATLEEVLAGYYTRFDNCHPVNGFTGSLEHLSRYLASREQFRRHGFSARLILEQLRKEWC